MNTKSGIHYTRPTDQAKIEELRALFRGESLQQLVDRFNREVRIGITGVHMQMLFLTTLGQVIYEQTGQDPLFPEGPEIRPMRYLTIVNGRLVQQENN